MSDPARLVRGARRVVLFAATALCLYGLARFDVVLLPQGAHSPLYGLAAGDRLLVDRHERACATGETWLYLGAADELLIGRAAPAPGGLAPEARAALAAGAAWLVAERDVAGASDSRALGLIPRERRVGRVLFVLPW